MQAVPTRTDESLTIYNRRDIEFVSTESCLPQREGSIMKGWCAAGKDSLLPGALAGVAVIAAVMLAGRKESGSAIAPINASSHVIWGDEAAAVERPTLRHTVPGLLINFGAAMWWAFVFQKLFGRIIERGGNHRAIAAGTATAGLAYLVDYHLVPKRLTPGWEKRLSGRSLFVSLRTMGAGLGLGAIASRKMSERQQLH